MEKDEETGLSYHHHRYLAVWLGRWCSSDPIGLGGGINRWAYCSGNPVSRNDTAGQFEWPWTLHHWSAPQQREDGAWYQDRTRIDRGRPSVQAEIGVLLDTDAAGRLIAHEGPLGTVHIAPGDIRSRDCSTQLQVGGEWHDWSDSFAYEGGNVSAASYYRSNEHLPGGRHYDSDQKAQTFVGAAFGFFGAVGRHSGASSVLRRVIPMEALIVRKHTGSWEHPRTSSWRRLARLPRQSVDDWCRVRRRWARQGEVRRGPG